MIVFAIWGTQFKNIYLVKKKGQHMKNTSRIISIFLIAAVIFTMPGVAFTVSAATKNDKTVKSSFSEIESEIISGINYEKDSENNGAIYPEKSKKQSIIEAFRKAEKNGSLVVHTNISSASSNLLSKAKNDVEAYKSGLPSRSAASQYQDMSQYLKTVTYPYILNNTNTGVNLPNGALTASYPLVNIMGIGGMNLSLELKYDSSDSNTDEINWSESTNELYYITIQDVVSYENPYGDNGTTYYEPTTLWYDTYSDYQEELYTYEHFLPSQFDDGDYTCVHQLVIVEHGSTRMPEMFVVDKSGNAASNGLGAGWKFNIPNIETLQYVEPSTGLNVRSHKIINLDTGEAFNVNGTQFVGRELQDITLQSICSTVNQRTATLLLERKDGKKYYFDEDGLCLKKEDRFGNTIYYSYLYNGDSALLSEISDDFGRRVSLAYTYPESGDSFVTISASDGTNAIINVNTENQTYSKLTSISYGNGETYQFSYSYLSGKVQFSNANESYEGFLNYALLQSITYPSGDSTVLTYTSESTNFGGGSKVYYFLSSSKDIISGEDRNTITYSRTGNSYNASYYNSLSDYYKQSNSIDDYSFQIIVTTTAGASVYVFNEKCLCTYYSSGYKVEENLYNSYDLVSKKNVKDYGSSTSKNSMYRNSIETYTYDNKGNIISYTNPDGKQILYTYNDEYSILLTKQYSQDNTTNIIESNTLSSDNKNILEEIIKSNGEIVSKTTYTYDTKGNVITKTKHIDIASGETSTTIFSYSDNISRPSGISLNGVYCTSVSVSGIINADGTAQPTHTEIYKYDIAGRKTHFTDANGNATVTSYDTRGRVVSVSYADGTSESYTYNFTTNTVTHTDKSGYIISRIYDINGNLIAVKEIESGKLIKTIEYDDAGRLISESNCASSQYFSKTEYTYDCRERILSASVKNRSNDIISLKTFAYTISTIDGIIYCKNTKTIIGGSSSPSIVTFEYIDKMGRVVRSGNIHNGNEIYKTFLYDNVGNLISETAENGGTTLYTYNAIGNIITRTDALGNIEENIYSNTGLLISHSDACGNTTLYTYDILGRLITEETPFEGYFTRLKKYYYDSNGNTVRVDITDNASGTYYKTYKRTTSSYDTMGRVTSIISGGPNENLSTVLYTYDARGNILSTTTNGSTIRNSYNNRGELISVEDALGNTESYSYDDNGYMITKTDRNGTLFTYTYNALGAVISETAEKSGRTTQQKTYAYTSTGLIKTESGGGITISRSYDDIGRLISETEYDGTDTFRNEYEYNNLNNRTDHRVLVNGEVKQWESYTYDILGRLTSVGEKQWSKVKYDYASMILNEDGTLNSSYSLYDEGVYDEFCYMFNVEDDIYIYDRLTSIWTKFDFSHPDYAYVGGEIKRNGTSLSGFIDIFQDVEKSIIASYTVETISYNFEAEHDAGTYQKYFITSPENEIAYTAYIYNEYCYIYVGNAGGFSIPTYVQGGAVTTVAEYTYDAVGNLVSETKNNGTSTLYTYNNAGLPQTMQNKRGDTVLSGYTYSYFLDGNIKSITEADGKTTNYTYDKLGRVTKEEKIDNGTTFVIQYTYDSRGNRASKTENGIRTTYTYDLGNRLTAESSTGKVVTYSYDDNGNRCITYVNNNFAGVYAYDLFNKQISYTANNIGYTYYTYRPDGLRHSVGNNKHVWDGNNITAEKYYSSVTVYVYGIALIKSGTRYYLYSWHGDVIALINLAGSITKTYEYDAFGVEDDIDDSDSNPWRYCGEYYDKETKELYLRARYYDSVTGTFTQEDPIKDGNNWYSYCMGNPVVFTDPSGLRVVLQESYKIAGGGTTPAPKKKHQKEAVPALSEEEFDYKNYKVADPVPDPTPEPEYSSNEYEKPSIGEEIAKGATIVGAASAIISVAPAIAGTLVCGVTSGGIIAMPSKEDHYARNNNQPVGSLPQTDNEAKNSNWSKLSPEKSACHQFTAENGANTKRVSPDGKMEAVYDSQGRLVLADEDVGTYNLCPFVPDQGPITAVVTGIGHFFKDMLPWYLWGNSPDDQTTIVDRIVGSIGWR